MFWVLSLNHIFLELKVFNQMICVLKIYLHVLDTQMLIICSGYSVFNHIFWVLKV